MKIYVNIENTNDIRCNFRCFVFNLQCQCFTYPIKCPNRGESYCNCVVSYCELSKIKNSNKLRAEITNSPTTYRRESTKKTTGM